jgi:D-amino peptidase
MRVFVMTDLEGVSGIVGRSDGIGNKIEHIDEARRLLTGEVNAVVEGLVSGGADEIVVADGHGGSNTIIVESLHEKARLLRIGGETYPVAWSLDSAYDAAMQIGAHAMMGTRDGFLHHSFNSHAITHMRLNGKDIGEIGIITLLAAAYRTPTLLVAGDRAACREAKAFMPSVETVETKIGINRYSSIDRSPAEVRSELTRVAEATLRNIDQHPVVEVAPPYELTVQYMCPNLADGCEKRGGKRIDFLTVQQSSDEFVELWAQRSGWAPGIFDR